MGKIILVDKPKGMTSFDVCFKMRKIFGTKKIGHTGTLDPNATGLMMVLIDSATKIDQFMSSKRKEYVAEVKIGIRTDTEDIDGNIIEEKKETLPDIETIRDAASSFLGHSIQYPPMTSAIKINGKKLYEYQREGKIVEVPPRDIEVYEIEVLGIGEDSFTFRALVSGGTYIRTLGQDILKKLGIIGTLNELRRTAIDDFRIDEASSLEEISQGEYRELSTLEVLSHYYHVHECQRPQDIINGKPLKADLPYEDILCTDGDRALALYHKENGVYRCVRGLL